MPNEREHTLRSTPNSERTTTRSNREHCAATMTAQQPHQQAEHTYTPTYK